MIGIVIVRRATAGAGFCTPVLRITVLAPCAGGIAMISVFRCGVPAGAAGGRATMLTGGRIAPRPITHAVRSVVIIRCIAITTSACTPVLTGRILLPASITVTMAAGIDRLTLGLSASTAIITVSIAGASCGLLTL